MFNWINFLSFVVITTITPGPNTISSMTNASRIGLKKALPFNFGILTGFTLVMLICTFFSSALSSFLPIIKTPMKVFGAIYMLYLAWKVYNSGEIYETSSTKSGFLAGFLLQFVNVKIYIYCIVAMQAYILPAYQENIFILILFALFLSITGFLFTLLWALFGSLFKVLFSKYAKITNTIMAILLVYCAVALFL